MTSYSVHQHYICNMTRIPTGSFIRCVTLANIYSYLDLDSTCSFFTTIRTTFYNQQIINATSCFFI